MKPHGGQSAHHHRPAAVAECEPAARGRVHRAAPYVSWLKAAGCVAQRPARITGPVRITIAAGRPDRRRRDVDNLSKAALDLLVSHQVIEDDGVVVSLSSISDPDVADGREHVNLRRNRSEETRSGCARTSSRTLVGA